MPFDLEQWKESTKQKLQGWKGRMQKAGVNSAYYLIAASAFLPVVESAHRGDWSALAVLGSAVGTNLLANIVQKVKDKSDTEVAQVLEAEVRDAPGIKAEIDLMLEKLNALQEAEKALSDRDKAWFADLIQRELKNLNSGIKYEAKVIGGGAVAQGTGAKAVGAGGILIEGGVSGNGITIGNHNRVTRVETGTYIEKQVIESPAKNEQTTKNESARHDYLKRLRKYCDSLPLAAMGGDEGVDDKISLEDVYIQLDTNLRIKQTELEALRKGEKVDLTRSASPEQDMSMPGERDSKEQYVPAPVLEAVIATPCAVLLGDPGAGKSTFVRYLAAMQSAVNLNECNPLPGVDAGLLPIFITLRDLAPRLRRLDLDALPAEKQGKEILKALREHIQAELANLNAEEFFPELRKQLEAGTVLMVMDGLDEVPHSARTCIRQAVNTAIKEYNPQRLVVTCRVRSYAGDAVLPLPSFTLQPFDEEKIQRFVQAWYKTQTDLGHFTVEQAKLRADDLSKAAAGADLRELSSNPMMLTSMAIIHQKEIGLPRERVKLYNLAVDVLLRRWQKSKVGSSLVPSEGLAAFLKDDLRLRATLERLAYESHRASMKNKDGADLPRGTALDLLDQKDYLGSAGLASEFLDYVDQRAGLLIGRGGSDESHPSIYSFPHRTFQEYLAGCYLVSQRDLIRLLMKHAAEGDFWDLAVLLGIEEMYYNRKNVNTLLDLAYGLCPTTKPTKEAGRRALLWSGEIGRLIGEEKILADTLNPNGGKKFIARLKPALVSLLESKLPATERAEAGCVLDKLGDPRPEVMSVEAMQFCHVPAGEFVIGDGEEMHTLALPEFWMSKHPVTNAQFDQFVKAGGYQNEAYWQEAREAGLWKDGFAVRRIASFENGEFKEIEEKESSPHNFGEPFNLFNHPVVGINWYEMLAFTHWLTEHLREVGKFEVLDAAGGKVSRRAFQSAFQVLLPSEAEWEKAARGTKGLEYPWGNEASPDKANYADANIRATSAVGCFTRGASPYGLQDMSGNVWEWTRSIYKKYPYESDDGREDLQSKDIRVLRGGSFSYAAWNVRCACRLRFNPNDRYRYLGFRIVVVSPLLS